MKTPHIYKPPNFYLAVSLPISLSKQHLTHDPTELIPSYLTACSVACDSKRLVVICGGVIFLNNDHSNARLFLKQKAKRSK